MKFQLRKNILFLFALAATAASAQIGTNSPYSMYGLGTLNDRATGFNKGMNGVGTALSIHNQVNPLNSASYSSIDSLTFIFDVGMSLQNTAFTEQSKTVHANNANFEYAVAALRIRKHLGLSFGFQPYSSIGYKFSSKDKIVNTFSHEYSGEGGLHEVFVGAGWRPFAGFSIGANVGYLWGQIENNLNTTSTNTSQNTMYLKYSSDIATYKADFGLQYEIPITKKDNVTIGATYGLGHKIDKSAERTVTNVDNVSSLQSTDTYSLPSAYALPTTFAAGISWTQGDRWAVAADWRSEKWGSVEAPVFHNAQSSDDKPVYELKKGAFQDRTKFLFGASYQPDLYGRKFFQRMRYTMGVGYTTPYIKINGVEGPKEYSATVGFSLPIMNAYNNRSQLNVSAQWCHASAKDMISETTWRINIGITFNERWFMKWMVE